MRTTNQQLVEQTVATIEPIDAQFNQAAIAHHATLTKPEGSMGRLEAIGAELSAIQQSLPPRVENLHVVVCAGDHGVTGNHALGPFPRDVTAQMVANFVAQGAAINVIAGAVGAGFTVVNAGVDADLSGLDSPCFIDEPVSRGTADFTVTPAMTEDQLHAALALGMRVAARCAADGCDAVALGEMGIGNTTVASAMTSAFLQLDPVTVTGRGTGADDATLKRKIQVIEKAQALNPVNPQNGYEVLQKLGGLEIATLTGLALGLSKHRIAVVADGFISTAAVVAATRINARVNDYLFSGHLSPEPGHKLLLNEIGKTPLLDLGLRLGEGTGACLALGLLQTSARLMSSMATFADAGVDDR